MRKNSSSRRFVITLVIFMGLFAQFQTVLACELMDGKAKPVCCCDKPGDMSKCCATGSGCQDQAGPVPSLANCCQVSYEPVPSATAIAPEYRTQQVLLLDAPQPPPLPATFILPDFATSRSTLRFNYPRSLPVSGTHIYLLTNRFRF